MGNYYNILTIMTDKKSLNSNLQQFSGISAKQSLVIFEENINQCQHEMVYYKKEIEAMRSDLLYLENNVKNKQNDIPKNIEPEISRLQETLDKFRDDQNNENVSYQQQL